MQTNAPFYLLAHKGALPHLQKQKVTFTL